MKNSLPAQCFAYRAISFVELGAMLIVILFIGSSCKSENEGADSVEQAVTPEQLPAFFFIPDDATDLRYSDSAGALAEEAVTYNINEDFPATDYRGDSIS